MKVTDVPRIAVSRSDSMIALYQALGLIDPAIDEIKRTARRDEVKGKHVIGVIPIYTAMACSFVTFVPIRGFSMDDIDSLSLKELLDICHEPVTYQIKRYGWFYNMFERRMPKEIKIPE